MIAVFQIVTMDSWTGFLYNLMKGSPAWLSALYCCALIVFGSFFVINLFLAVIMQAFIKN